MRSDCASVCGRAKHLLTVVGNFQLDLSEKKPGIEVVMKREITLVYKRATTFEGFHADATA